MATPPLVTAADAADAIRRITDRHRDANDPGQHLLTDDPRDVLRFLRGCGTKRLRSDAGRHDLEDALTLRLFLWWEGQDAEQWCLEAVETLRAGQRPDGVTVGLRRRAGAVLGVGTGQGVVDRLDRLRGLLGPNRRPDEKAVRAERRECDGQLSLDPAPESQGDRAEVLRAFIAAMLPYRDELPDDAYGSLNDLRHEATPDRATMSERTLHAEVNLLIAELRAADLSPAARSVVDRVVAVTG